MYCPRCSQEQLSDHAVFCNRCGLQLGLVRELLWNNGVLPQYALQSRPSPKRLRRKGVRRGAKIIFLSLVLFPVFLGFSIAADSPGPLFVPFMIFFIGLVKSLYSIIFGEDVSYTQDSHQSVLSERAAAQGALPSPPNMAAGELGAARMNTAEMVRPHSVTEHTTKLLKTKKD